MGSTSLALKSAQDSGDKGEAAWAVELSKNYGGSKTSAGKTGGPKTAIEKGFKGADVSTYVWGKEYVHFTEFAMRGADLQHAKAAGKPTSPNRRQEDEVEAGREEINLGIDWHSMSSV